MKDLLLGLALLLISFSAIVFLTDGTFAMIGIPMGAVSITDGIKELCNKHKYRATKTRSNNAIK